MQNGVSFFGQFIFRTRTSIVQLFIDLFTLISPLVKGGGKTNFKKICVVIFKKKVFVLEK